MLLLIDMGNSNIVLGRIRNPKESVESKTGDFNEPFLDRIITDRRMNVGEYQEIFEKILSLHDIKASEITGCIMSSTVPVLTNVIKKAFENIISVPVINLTGSIPCGIKIIRERPETLGADIIAGAVGAKTLYGCPAVVVDMGTCTTIAAIDKDGAYKGGVIMPGVKTSLDGMKANASHLPEILFERPEGVIGTDTETCIQSGVMYGHACSVEGLVKRIWKELGYETKVIVTGGFAKRVMAGADIECIMERDLVFKGLAVIFTMNN